MELSLTDKDLASFQQEHLAWIADAGQYKIEIGVSSLDIKQKVNLNLKSELIVEKVHDVLNNKGSFLDMKR